VLIYVVRCSRAPDFLSTIHMHLLCLLGVSQQM
jgi:hypothetical protein